MDRKHSFQPTAEDEREIRQCSKIFFDGGNPSAIEELKPFWKKWEVFFEMFLFMRDARYGNFLHLPFDGGVFDQPCKTMKIFLIIQSFYIEKLESEQEKAFKSVKTTTPKTRF